MERIDTAEVAKLVRKELKAYYPAVKFSVKSKRYAGGSSIDVHWTDGPTVKQVERIAGHFHGADFDGMQDLKEYNGRPYGNDYIFCSRSYSAAMQQEVMAYVCNRWGFTLPQWKPEEIRHTYRIAAHYTGDMYQVSNGAMLTDEYNRTLHATPAAEYTAGSEESFNNMRAGRQAQH